MSYWSLIEIKRNHAYRELLKKALKISKKSICEFLIKALSTRTLSWSGIVYGLKLVPRATVREYEIEESDLNFMKCIAAITSRLLIYHRDALSIVPRKKRARIIIVPYYIFYPVPVNPLKYRVIPRKKVEYSNLQEYIKWLRTTLCEKINVNGDVHTASMLGILFLLSV